MSNSRMSLIVHVLLRFMVHVHHNKVCLAMVHIQIIYIHSGICPNDTSPTMVYVQVIYVHWWYINLLICMFIISEVIFIKW